MCYVHNLQYDISCATLYDTISGKVIEHKISVLIFSAIFSEIFLILRRIQ